MRETHTGIQTDADFSSSRIFCSCKSLLILKRSHITPPEYRHPAELVRHEPQQRGGDPVSELSHQHQHRRVTAAGTHHLRQTTGSRIQATMDIANTFWKNSSRYVNHIDAQISLQTWPRPYPKMVNLDNFDAAIPEICLFLNVSPLNSGNICINR